MAADSLDRYNFISWYLIILASVGNFKLLKIQCKRKNSNRYFYFGLAGCEKMFHGVTGPFF
jgi:hypothetical protein